MTESSNGRTEKTTGVEQRNPSPEDVQKSLEAEIREMEKYKWYLGEKLNHDPLQDRSLNDIYCEWIEKYASDFRRDWDLKNGDQLPN